MKYEFLLGQRFRLQNQTFEAVEVMELEANRIVVKGVAVDGIGLTRNFPASLVVESLVFESKAEAASA